MFFIVLSFLVFIFFLSFYGSIIKDSQRLIGICQYPAGWLQLESWWGASMCTIHCQNFYEAVTHGWRRWRWNHFYFPQFKVNLQKLRKHSASAFQISKSCPLIAFYSECFALTGCCLMLASAADHTAPVYTHLSTLCLIYSHYHVAHVLYV